MINNQKTIGSINLGYIHENCCFLEANVNAMPSMLIMLARIAIRYYELRLQLTFLQNALFIPSFLMTTQILSLYSALIVEYKTLHAKDNSCQAGDRITNASSAAIETTHFYVLRHGGC